MMASETSAFVPVMPLASVSVTSIEDDVVLPTTSMSLATTAVRP